MGSVCYKDRSGGNQGSRGVGVYVKEFQLSWELTNREKPSSIVHDVAVYPVIFGRTARDKLKRFAVVSTHHGSTHRAGIAGPCNYDSIIICCRNECGLAVSRMTFNGDLVFINVRVCREAID